MVGTFFTWQSGSPVNEFGTAPLGVEVGRPVFLVPRGSAGRTPAILDLNLRLAYDARWPRTAGSRLVLDVLHVGNPQQVVRVDQLHFLGVDSTGAQTNENPGYLHPVAFSAPMTVRLGVEISF